MQPAALSVGGLNFNAERKHPATPRFAFPQAVLRAGGPHRRALTSPHASHMIKGKSRGPLRLTAHGKGG